MTTKHNVPLMMLYICIKFQFKTKLCPCASLGYMSFPLFLQRHAENPYLFQTIIQGTVKGKKKERQTEGEMGKQYQRVEGMDFACSTRAAENRARWKG